MIGRWTVADMMQMARTVEPLVGNIAEAREIIEAFAFTDSGDTVGSVSCDLKTHRDYPCSWAVDAAKAWLIANAEHEPRAVASRAPCSCSQLTTGGTK